MAHGNFSDIAGLILIAGGIQQMFYPEYQFKDFPPMKPFFDGKMTADMEIMIKFMGGFLVIIGCMLFTVRWNNINGKLSGLACLGCAANIAWTTYKVMDKETFVPRPFYIYAAVLALLSVHLVLRPKYVPVEKTSEKKSK
mmetsp:Transcript_52035/g.111368  ORF Transcript_52035/g.111368 Transcript_52035/m.111368 type:complete len:140 (+) Transcript_52035:88-507(+)